MKEPAGGRRAEGDETRVANAEPAYTLEELQDILNLVNDPSHHPLPRMNLARHHMRMGLTFYRNAHFDVGEVGVQLRRLQDRLENGELALRTPDDTRRLLETVRAARDGDERAFARAARFLNTHRYAGEPSDRLHLKRRRPLPTAVTDYLATVQREEPSPLQLEAQRLGLL